MGNSRTSNNSYRFFLLSLVHDSGLLQVSTIEFSLVEVSVMHGLKQGNEVLKEIHKELNVESVEQLLEETHEAQAYQQVCSRHCRSLVLESNHLSRK